MGVSVIVGIVGGIGEQNVGTDFNLAQVLWLLFVLCAGAVISLVRPELSWQKELALSVPAAIVFFVMIAIGCLFWGACNASGFELYRDSEPNLKHFGLLVLAGTLTPFAILFATWAWPTIIGFAISWLRKSQSEQKKIIASITRAGGVFVAIVLLFRTLTLAV